MAANIFVDPVIVATPDEATDRDGIVAWLENLALWLKEALSAHFTWLHSAKVTELLEVNGRFPDFMNLRDLQRKYHLDINPTLLARNVNEFFRNPEFDLGNSLENVGVLAEIKNGSVSIQPAAMTTRWPDFIQTVMHSLLVTSCVCKQIAHAFTQHLHIATLKFSDQIQEITVSAIITYVIPELVCQPGDAIVQTFPLLFTPEDLLPLINVLEFWYKGEGGIVYMIEQRHKKDWQKSGGPSLQFSLGSHFIESVNATGLDTNELVLRRIIMLAAATIADEIKHIPGAKLHPLRISPAPDSPQRMRGQDQASAWRIDVMKYGAGWRLHYWHIPGADGGRIEFSNVCKESEDTIYE
jgi:hypothetical protein